MISTRDLTDLLPPSDLLNLSQSLAMLEAIVMPEWLSRYYSFDANWKHNTRMASMQDGEGDHYHIFFCDSGTIITGFSHESVMSRYPLEHGAPCVNSRSVYTSEDRMGLYHWADFGVAEKSSSCSLAE